MTKNSYRFFANQECEYYPCHTGLREMNCLFCYCPFYRVEHCPGNPMYMEKEGRKIKNCRNCVYPHKAENYEDIMQRLRQE